jgi:hypothetical protein
MPSKATFRARIRVKSRRVSTASRWKALGARWCQNAKPLAHDLAQRLARHRWPPQLPIALFMASLGLLPVAAAVQDEFGLD